MNLKKLIWREKKKENKDLFEKMETILLEESNKEKKKYQK